MPKTAKKSVRQTKVPTIVVKKKVVPKINGARLQPDRNAKPTPVVSAGNKPNPEVEISDPPPIKTEAPMPVRRTKMRRPDATDEKVDEKKDEKEFSDEQAAARARRRTRRSEERERPEAISSVESGSRFVRMLNRDRRVVGVIANYVPERLTENYRFIEGEPVIPTRTGPEDSCPGLKKLRARDYDYPVNVFDAIQLWRDAMLDDLDEFDREDLKDRQHDGIIRKLTSILDNPSAFGMVYGVAPTGKVSEAIGYKN